MSEPGQIIGDIAAGALAARAVEPAHGEAAAVDGHTHERACLNCATPLVGSHCHNCGQAAHVHKTIAAFFHDLVHGVFHFEGKIWRTLPLLVWHPGRLTREYIDGRRASYVSPIALFLFVVFLTFALFNLVEGPVNVTPRNVQAGLHADVAKAQARLAVLEAERRTIAARGGDTRAIDAKVQEAKNSAGLEKAIADDGLRGAARRASDDVPAWLAEPLRSSAENPALAIFKLQSSAYKYSWLLIPLSVPFVWLLFPFSRRFHLYDHTVFVTYSLSFMLLVLAAVTAINVWTSLGGLIAILILYVPFHMHRQLREAYGLTRLGALWRTAALSWFASIALVLWALSVLALAMG